MCPAGQIRQAEHAQRSASAKSIQPETVIEITQGPSTTRLPESGCGERMIWCRSVSMISYTMYTSLQR